MYAWWNWLLCHPGRGRSIEEKGLLVKKSSDAHDSAVFQPASYKIVHAHDSMDVDGAIRNMCQSKIMIARKRERKRQRQRQRQRASLMAFLTSDNPRQY